MTVLFMSLAWLNTWSNVEESGINGRYYWKDSSLDNRYCNWYYCDRFNWYFFLWFVFRIGIIPVGIGWIKFSKKSVRTQRDPLEFLKERVYPRWVLYNDNIFASYNMTQWIIFFPMFQKKTPFHFFSNVLKNELH